jgi:hypothetical protein
MPFNNAERASLLKVKGVGPTVVKRLEEMGITSLDQLSRAQTGHCLAGCGYVGRVLLEEQSTGPRRYRCGNSMRETEGG